MISSSENWYFDHEEADKAVHFVEHFCSHVKGSYAGKPFLLNDWQCTLVREAFGRKSTDGTRRYKHIWVEAPRKSGKTTFAAALLLYMLLVDKEKDTEACIISPSVSISSVCMNIVKRMIENNSDMRDVCAVRANEVFYKCNRISLVSGASSSLSGRDVSFAVLDDLQEGLSREVYEMLVSCAASRDQPLFLYLAAVGDPYSIAAEMHRYAVEITTGNVLDSSWLIRIFGATSDDDWTDPEVWARAHPGLDQSVSRHFLREQCLRALNTPGYVDVFRRLYLNVWTEESVAWLDMSSWDSRRAPIHRNDVIGRSCIIGLDLSTSTDLTAVVAVFREANGGYTLLSFPFCPEEAIRKRVRLDKVAYDQWRDKGFLVATEGNVIDYTVVRDKILALYAEYSVQEIAYDRWGSSMLINQLVQEGVHCTPVNQDALTMSRPAEELERVLSEGTLRHDGNPVLRWCASNVILERNALGVSKPSKRKSRDRIDLIISALMAISRFLILSDAVPEHQKHQNL